MSVKNNESFTPEQHAECKAALSTLIPLAEGGDPTAQYFLGEMYLEGHGIECDYKAAFRWLEAASVQGHSSAQKRLGDMYSRGLYIDQCHKYF